LQANCSLIGGETAEMPGMYSGEEYDVAGFAVGVVEEEQLVDGSKISNGDIVIGLSSSGLHSNGFSLVRELFFKQAAYQVTDYLPELGTTLGEELLKPTRIYVKTILELLKQVSIKGMAHITGGGLLENIPRVLPDGLQAEIKLGSWEIPPIFKGLQKIGNLKKEELYRTFNMGIGYVIIINQQEQELALQLIKELGERAYVIGRIKEGGEGLVLVGEES